MNRRAGDVGDAGLRTDDLPHEVETLRIRLQVALHFDVVRVQRAAFWKGKVAVGACKRLRINVKRAIGRAQLS